jgi:hypothetical protein
MSLEGQRAAIAAALSTVDDVTGHQYRPRTLPPGTAWPLLGGLDEGPARDFLATWRIVVVLPADEIAASKWFDGHHEDVAAALANFGRVTRIEPGLVQTDAGDMEAMFLTVEREA